MPRLLQCIFRTSQTIQHGLKVSRNLKQVVALRSISMGTCIHFKREIAQFQKLSNQIEHQEKHVNKEDILAESFKHADFFSLAELFNTEDLMRANVHLGHRDGTLNNYMKPYIFGSRLSHLVIDLEQTVTHLRDALNFIAHMAFREAIILFICRGVQHQLLVEETAAECKEFSHTRIWDEGIFTSSLNIFGKEVRLPDMVIFLNTMNDALNEHPAVKETARMAIPTVGIVDTNCNPTLITYPVPGNDDTHTAIELYCNLFKEAILRGKQKRIEFNL